MRCVQIAGCVVSLLSLVACGQQPAPSLTDPLASVERIDADTGAALAALSDEQLAAETLIVQVDDNPFAFAGVDVAADLMVQMNGAAIIERRALALPYLTMRVDDQPALSKLLAANGVVRVFRDEPHEAHLATSLPFIGQPAARAAGVTGAGTAVAVLDTGLDWHQPAFGTCSAVGAVGCRVVHVGEFATDDGALDDNGHGTNVAGIVAGVAPDAGIIGLDVFRGAAGYSSDIIAAIDWVVTHQADHNIVAFNMSLGSGGSTTACGNDVFAAAVRTARLAGILATVSSGNNGFTDRISSPACVPDAISVGAVYDTSMAGTATYSSCADSPLVAGRPTCFSNTASFLTVLAPGGFIEAAGRTMSGTSQAAPHVAGAVALVAAAFPDDSADARVARLTASGPRVTDPRTGLSFPRLDVGAAVTTAPCQVSLTATPSTVAATGGSGTVAVSTSAQCPWTLSSNGAWLTLRTSSGSGPGSVVFDVAAGGVARSAVVAAGAASVVVTQSADTTPPVGTVAFDGITLTNNRAVTLVLSASDASGVTQMCVSNTTTCTAWVGYATRFAWTLAPSGASATVRVWFRDARNNASTTPATATIAYDATLPTNGAVTAVAGDARVALTWSGFADAGSGVSSYVVVSGSTAPATCTTGTVLQQSAATSFTHTNLTNGVVVGYRVCAKDAAGNLGTGVVASARPVPETAAPTGTVAITGAPGPLKSSAVVLTLAASDVSGVTHMCLSNTATCTAFVAFATTKTWSLASGSGSRTVNVWFRDTWGNTMAAPASAQVNVDTTLPVNGVASASAGNAQVTVQWSGFSDAHSGLTGHRLAWAATTAPANCSSGTQVSFSATTLSTTLTGLQNGVVYGVRVCGVDAAGNLSAGVTATAKPVPETVAPSSGSVVINAGAALTRSRSVQLSLTASDASGVTHMCLSNAATCTAWVAFATATTWSLASGNGSKTVNVWFRDTWGNATTAAVSDAINVDATAPTVGTVVATPGRTSVALSWSGFTDVGSGVVSYKVVSSSATPTNCSSGVVVAEQTSTNFTHSGLSANTRYGYRVCAIDAAGNIGAGAAALVTTTP